MAPRAVWKGYLRMAELACPVSLYTAVSTSDRIAFHTLNRATGHRVRRQFVDSETGKPVEREDQIKGYQVSQGEYVTFEPDEIASLLPESDKALAVDTFVPCREIDEVFLDRPYFLTPSDAVAAPAYGLIRDALSKSKVAAIARAVLFRKVRTVLVRPHAGGLMANLLNFDYEVRSSNEVFESVPELTIKDEMLDLAQHIIKTKMGSFDPKAFEDRYENAVAEMVRAKMEGRPLAAKPAPKASNVVDLLEALRQSAKAADGKTAPDKASPAKKSGVAADKSKGKAADKAPAKAAPRRKAG